MIEKAVRGRFAPSPSGRMHLGNVFCALISWLSLRAEGGVTVLRIEDLDTQRCRDEYVTQLLDDLHFLGLEFDEGEEMGGAFGPYRQSERLAMYEEALSYLSSTGNVYPCYCSRDELHAPSAPHASDGRVLYSGTCRSLTTSQRASKTRPPAYRLIASDVDVTFDDGHYGPQRFNVRGEWGDFLVRRSDGMFAYQLAVSVDDAAMNITQVVRGRDLLSSVAPQQQLFALFHREAPTYYHIPMLLSADGRRLSKRDKDLDMGELRARFGTPEPIIGKLLFLAGVIPYDEPLTAREAISYFSWNKMSRADIILTSQMF